MVHAADIGSKTKQAQSRQTTDIDVVACEKTSAEVGSYQQQLLQQKKGTRSHSTGKRQDSVITRRQSTLWERAGNRLQRADTSSFSKAEED